MSGHPVFPERRKFRQLSFLLVCPLLLFSSGRFAVADSLEAGFRSPPNSAKPHTWWHWNGGAITKEGITADLEAMARGGIGGYQLFNVKGYRTPENNVKMLSPQWFDLLKHAFAESARLGLEAGIQNCPGFATTGGPWITPEMGQQEVVWTEAIVQGGKPVKLTVPRPAVKTTYGIEFNYSDIATLAVPLPEDQAADFRKQIKNVTCSPAPQAAKLDYNLYTTPGVKVDYQPDPPDARAFADGRLDTGCKLPLPTERQPLTLTYELTKPFTARACELGFLPVPGASPDGMEFAIECREEGAENFKPVGKFKSLNSDDHIATRCYLELAPVTANAFKIVITKAQPKVKFLLPSEIVFHSGSRRSFMRTGSIARVTDIKYDRAKEREAPLTFDPNKVINLTDQLSPDGTLAWDAPDGDWLVLRFGHSCNGATIHPAPEGMDGLECDKLNKAAFDLHWEKGVQPYLDAAGEHLGSTFTTILFDSMECGSQNWSGRFPEEFEKRRGYAIIPYMPAFAAISFDSSEVQPRFKQDHEQTVADLMHENYFDYSCEVIHQHGLLCAREPYSTGIFSSSIAARKSDIPMREFWLFSHHQGERGAGFALDPGGVGRLCQSVAEQHGQRIVGAEAFTQGWYYPNYWYFPFEDHPRTMKWRGDQMMADGVNRFYFHTFAHQPFPGKVPGLNMAGWGFQMHGNQTWWDHVDGFARYCARSGWMLQEGDIVKDICVWSPNETWYAALSFPTRAWRFQGYDFTLLGNDVFLERGAAAEDGAFTTGDKRRYPVLVALGTHEMSVAELQKLDKVISAGAIFIGAAPRSPKGLSGKQNDDQQYNLLRKKLWDGVDPKQGKPHGKGYIYTLGSKNVDESIENIVRKHGIKPDFEVRGEKIRQRRSGFTYCHRRDQSADWYFIANQEPKAKRVDCVFRVNDRQPELWDPVTGEIKTCDVFDKLEDGRLKVPIDFDADGSLFVVFREPIKPKRHFTAVDGDMTNAQVADGRLTARGNGSWKLHKPDGVVEMNVKELPAPQTLQGPWNVVFQKDRGAPDSVILPELQSLSLHENQGVRHFSGLATYEITFEFLKTWIEEGRRVYLDLGQVEVSAEVTINQHTFKPLWKSPYRLDITDALKPGANQLRIVVANTWVNRIIGDLGLAEKERITWSSFNEGNIRWKKDDPLPPSGLIGPVRLVPAMVREIYTKNDKEVNR